MSQYENLSFTVQFDLSAINFQILCFMNVRTFIFCSSTTTTCLILTFFGEKKKLRYCSFPDHQRAAPAPVQIVWLDNALPRAVNPRFSGPIPRFTVQQFPQSDSRSNQDEQTNILTKLKKEIYNPLPKQMTRRLSSFYRDHQNNRRSSSYNVDKGDEDGKRCAICLEDFEGGEQVMVTPCDHMFHEECILPWVRSHGQCPVCRFVLSDRIQQSRSAASSISNVNNVSNVPPTTDLFAAGELISIIRAMEEAFLWGSR